ncbi:MAG TPA: adenylate/guanylate cyclase domain-containing protein [Acidimicrobiales bacterium]
MRVIRSFAFTDLSGFTTLTETEGDERAVRVLTSFRTVLREICSRRGVRIAKWLGDGAMLVGVDPTPLLGAALEMHWAIEEARTPSERFAVRTGISSGEVILLEGDDYIGHPVNVAARLCDQAEGEQLLTDASMVPSLPRWGASVDPQDIALRGLERPLSVATLVMRKIAGPTVPDPVCGIPLTAEVAEAVAVDPLGNEVWFCADSCRDTWERRPAPPSDEFGSLRTPLL